MKTIRFAGILLVATLPLAATACTQGAEVASEVSEASAASGSQHADSVAEPGPAQQKALDAYAESESSAANGVFAEVVRSVVVDLDGDGTQEVVAEINWYMGNSHFGRLVVFVDDGNGLRKVAQSEDPLGLVEGIGVADGLIRVESRWPGPNDARCCPSLEKTAHYRWQGDKVVEVATGAAPAATK